MGKGIEVELARLRLRLKLDPRLSPLRFCLIVIQGSKTRIE
jgi:hypothetical protein